jgi:hypothetical protein
MLNIEQGISNIEGQDYPSVFEIPCSVFDIQALLLPDMRLLNVTAI